MEEVSSCLRMLDEVYRVFGLTYKAALSTRPDSYLGTLEQWDTAESALRSALDQTGKAWEVSHDAEAAHVHRLTPCTGGPFWQVYKPEGAGVRTDSSIL